MGYPSRYDEAIMLVSLLIFSRSEKPSMIEFNLLLEIIRINNTLGRSFRSDQGRHLRGLGGRRPSPLKEKGKKKEKKKKEKKRKKRKKEREL